MGTVSAKEACLSRKLSVAVAVTLTITAALFAREYDELYRPQFHFSPRANWTNDPCGLVYAFGKYHLFFQHNPFENHWGHMSWGHTVSSDLVSWNQLPSRFRMTTKPQSSREVRYSIQVTRAGSARPRVVASFRSIRG